MQDSSKCFMSRLTSSTITSIVFKTRRDFASCFPTDFIGSLGFSASFFVVSRKRRFQTQYEDGGCITTITDPWKIFFVFESKLFLLLLLCVLIMTQLPTSLLHTYRYYFLAGHRNFSQNLCTLSIKLILKSYISLKIIGQGKKNL